MGFTKLLSMGTISMQQDIQRQNGDRLNKLRISDFHSINSGV